ncbi:MAG TPA: glycosyltransferase family 4 protein [Anaeromyxobacteraceae bacterium]|nr:glycosyltransferase family 4 protein [Anaeromyxobacteraceae bacterium]
MDAVRVLELLSSPAWTGPAEPMASVARELSRRGHDVEIAVDTRREGDVRARLEGLGFRVRTDLALSTKGGPGAFLGDLLALRRASAAFDVLHANFSNDHALALLAAAGRRECRVVRTVHSSRSLRRRGLQGWIHRASDGLVAVCEAHARVLRDDFRVPAERVCAVRGAVDADVFRPDGPDLRAELGIAPDAPVVGIVSRVKPDRRHVELLEAFRAVRARLPAARLVVVGRGEGLEDVQERALTLGLASSVVFAGYRRGEALAAAYRTLDAKVLLAEGNDGTCRALLEAMASGRPGIAYRFGAPAESIVDGATGRLVEEGDVEALGTVIAEILGEPERARAMGRVARERMVALYTEEARGAAVEEFLVRVRRMPRP